MKEKLRNSNYELLRLISMYMIILIHANMYLPFFCEEESWYLFFNGMANGICNIGVTCFILISGFYGLQFSLKKLIKMELMMIIFSSLEFVLLYILFPEKMVGSACLEQLIKTICPFITRKYWFYSSYVCLFIFSKYMNQFVDSLKKEEFKKVLYIMLLLFSVLPTFIYFEIIPDNGKGIVQMVMIYLIGRYIKVHGGFRLDKKKAMIIFVVFWAINGVSHEILPRISPIYHHFCKDNSITNIIMAIILFQIFKDFNISNKIINKVASYNFAVFALNNTIVMIFMEYFAEFTAIENSVIGIVLLNISVMAIFAGCLFVGYLNEKIFGRVMDKISLVAIVRK